ncbi:hypothetical protein N7466_002849 [Penicillium verhagenii]|uniref:uncharacterized protein n=1 Tax=Penicillium verhagenii TaxID=1562060 RepID=UPI002544EA88|nr:uncharacterized protein N7466_002849 [Penicillium verhagenii]KAJ5939715.1 hypothetical protein N7466_002849 [Penicillium verhagenii]
MWIPDVSSSLEEWYITTPQDAPKETVLFRHLMYNYLKAKIYRPTPQLPTRTAKDRQMCFDVCQRIIESGNSLFECKLITYPWQMVHILFGAVVILLEACWQYRFQPLMTPSVLHVLFVLIPQCLEVLSEIGRGWSEANLCKMCLQSMLAEVAYTYDPSAFPGLSPMPDAVTTENLKNLLFADRLPSDNMLSDEAALAMESQIFENPMYTWDIDEIQWSSWC